MGPNRLRPGLKEPGFSFAKIRLLNVSRSGFGSASPRCVGAAAEELLVAIHWK
jgi:hypothetical protein